MRKVQIVVSKSKEEFAQEIAKLLNQGYETKFSNYAIHDNKYSIIDRFYAYMEKEE